MRKWIPAGMSLTAAAAGVWLLPVLLGEKPGQADEPAARAAQLPLARVLLYSSGVGYFQREGSAEGDARLDLSLPVSDVNDLIKSMVVRDLDVPRRLPRRVSVVTSEPGSVSAWIS